MEKITASLFLLLGFSISAKAQSINLLEDLKSPEVTTTVTMGSLLDSLIPKIISGQEEEIRTAILEVVSSSPPINRIFQESSSRLLGIGEMYLDSSLNSYNQLEEELSGSVWTAFTLNKRLKRLEYLEKKDRNIKALRSEWYLSLIFLSWAGFNSSVGKDKYMEAFLPVSAIS